MFLLIHLKVIPKNIYVEIKNENAVCACTHMGTDTEIRSIDTPMFPHLTDPIFAQITSLFLYLFAK